jgi:hypothetical protein
LSVYFIKDFASEDLYIHRGGNIKPRTVYFGLFFRNPTPPTKPTDRPSRLNVKWLAVQDFGSDSLHMRYYNIGQVVLRTPNDFLNENLGPVKLNMAVDLHKKGMTFWESLNSKEN